jgi:hypothetical protein
MFFLYSSWLTMDRVMRRVNLQHLADKSIETRLDNIRETFQLVDTIIAIDNYEC